MAKTKAPAKSKAVAKEPAEVVAEYDLLALPTAFHKAGLAGLVLLIESLKARKLLTGEDAKYEMTASTLKVTFTEPLVRKLMDDIYDAELAERKEKKARSKSKAKSDNEDAKEAKEPPPMPKLKALEEMLPEENPLWIKLWREMIFQGPRNQPTTWLPYKDRAAGLPYLKKPNRDPWADMLVHQKKKAKGQVATTAISGSLLLGVQDANPEQVPCEGRIDQTLLLHFWPLAVLVYAPQVIDREGKTTAAGYTLAIPEVANLKEFIVEYRRMLHGLDTGLTAEQAKRGFRPTRAVIDLAAESALSFLANLAAITTEKMAGSALAYSVSSVEYLHIFKQKRNVKTMAAGRVSPNRNLLRDYRSIVTPKPGVDPIFRNPLFRRGLLLALLDSKPWYEPFLKMLTTAPTRTRDKSSEGKTRTAFDVGFFLRQPPRTASTDPKTPPPFATDAAMKLRHDSQIHTATLERYKVMPEQSPPNRPLELLVDQVVRSFLLGKAKSKCNIDKKKKLKELSKEEQKKVFEKKRDVAEEAFLAVRSRRDQDFVKYFTEVICSAGTYFDRKSSDYLDFATALNDPSKTDSIKALTLLSLSANS